MFTGIIQSLGRVVSGRAVAPGRLFCLDAGSPGLDRWKVGSSIAVNGVCLSVTRLEAPRFWVEVTGHTLSLSNLGGLREGDMVNLEGALALGEPLDGHLLAGHVDGSGEVVELETGADAGLTLRLPAALEPYLCERGSIAVDGVSLTVAAVRGNCFRVALIPHTLKHTTLGRRAVGTRLNLEVDLVARYLARLLDARGAGRIPGEARHGTS